MKAYEGLKLWSLFFGHNGFTHGFIGPKTNSILLVTLSHTMNQKCSNFPLLVSRFFGFDS
jgi:hypothetical protein